MNNIFALFKSNKSSLQCENTDVSLHMKLNKLRKEFNVELSVSVFISEEHDQIIVSPEGRVANVGIRTGRGSAISFTYNEDPKLVGEEIINSLLSFNDVNIDLNKPKNYKPDGPGPFNISKVKTRSRFEREYIHLNIITYHPSLYLNVIGKPVCLWNDDIEIVKTLTIDNNITLMSINIGEKILNIFKACKLLDEQKYT